MLLTMDAVHYYSTTQGDDGQYIPYNMCTAENHYAHWMKPDASLDTLYDCIDLKYLEKATS